MVYCIDRLLCSSCSKYQQPVVLVVGWICTIKHQSLVVVLVPNDHVRSDMHAAAAASLSDIKPPCQSISQSVSHLPLSIK